MIPKLALNFVVDCKATSVADLQPFFDTMKRIKVIYVEAILVNIESVEQLKEYNNAFKAFRNSKHVDYTIWVDDWFKSEAQVIGDVKRIINEIKADSIQSPMVSESKKAAPKVIQGEKLVMGIATLNPDIGYTEIPFIYYGNNTEPDLMDLANYDDGAALKHSMNAINSIHAPEGMKRGLKRVIDDYSKLSIGGVQQDFLELEQLASSVQDSE